MSIVKDVKTDVLVPAPRNNDESIHSIPHRVCIGLAGVFTALLIAGSWAALRSQETPPERVPEVRDKNVMQFKLYYCAPPNISTR